MYVYIGFPDKKNHAIRFCESQEAMDDFKKKWEKNYILELVFTTPAKFGENRFYRAKVKNNVYGNKI